jgi:hypothetical protein
MSAYDGGSTGSGNTHTSAMISGGKKQPSTAIKKAKRVQRFEDPPAVTPRQKVAKAGGRSTKAAAGKAMAAPVGLSARMRRQASNMTVRKGM